MSCEHFSYPLRQDNKKAQCKHFMLKLDIVFKALQWDTSRK